MKNHSTGPEKKSTLCFLLVSVFWTFKSLLGGNHCNKTLYINTVVTFDQEKLFYTEYINKIYILHAKSKLLTAQTRYHCRNHNSQAPASSRTNRPNVPITQQIGSQLVTRIFKQRAELSAPSADPNHSRGEKVLLNVSNVSHLLLDQITAAAC